MITSDLKKEYTNIDKNAQVVSALLTFLFLNNSHTAF